MITLTDYRLRPAQRKRGRGIMSGAALMLALGGCEALHPGPSIDRTAFAAQAQQGPVAQSRWWASLKDPTLDQLEHQALAQNLDLKLAMERVIQSRETAVAAGATLLPQVGLAASEKRAALSADGPMAAVGAPSAPSTLWQAGVSMQWELDLWSRARNQQAAAQESAEAAAADLNGAQLALTAEVARTYVQLRAAQQIVTIIEGNEAISNRSVRIAESRFQNGVSGANDTASAKAQQESVEALLPAAQAQVAKLSNALCALLALPPGALDGPLKPARPIPAMARMPQAVPSELAKGRPDIAAAEATLAAAIHDRAAAKANFYPSVSLGGSFGKEGWTLGDVREWGSRTWSIGPSFSLPIFTGGRITAQYEVARSKEQAAAISYRKTVLEAWRQIDDALTDARAATERASHLRAAETQYSDALKTAENAYEQGTTEYLPTLVAQRDLLAGQQALAQARMQATLAAIDLYRAVGTGWLAASGTGTGTGTGTGAHK